MATAVEVAQWMIAELRTEQALYQEQAVHDIAARFGDHFTYLNAAGNLAIAKDVLAEFRRMTGEAVVWSRSDRSWRLREEHDEPGRLQS